jgi:hypothetical protein
MDCLAMVNIKESYKIVEEHPISCRIEVIKFFLVVVPILGVFFWILQQHLPILFYIKVQFNSLQKKTICLSIVSSFPFPT